MIVENFLEEKIIYKDTWNNTTMNREMEQKDLQAVTKNEEPMHRKRLTTESNPVNHYTLRVTKEQRIPKFNTSSSHLKCFSNL